MSLHFPQFGTKDATRNRRSVVLLPISLQRFCVDTCRRITLLLSSSRSSDSTHTGHWCHANILEIKTLTVTNVKCIQAVVVMIPHDPPGVDAGNYHFLVERPGLDVTRLGGAQEVCDPE